MKYVYQERDRGQARGEQAHLVGFDAYVTAKKAEREAAELRESRKTTARKAVEHYLNASFYTIREGYSRTKWRIRNAPYAFRRAVRLKIKYWRGMLSPIEEVRQRTRRLHGIERMKAMDNTKHCPLRIQGIIDACPPLTQGCPCEDDYGPVMNDMRDFEQELSITPETDDGRARRIAGLIVMASQPLQPCLPVWAGVYLECPFSGYDGWPCCEFYENWAPDLIGDNGELTEEGV